MSIRDVYTKRSWTKIMAISHSDHMFLFVQIFLLGTIIQTFFYPLAESQEYVESRQFRKNLAVSKHRNDPHWLRDYKWKAPEKNYGRRQKPIWERKEGRKGNGQDKNSATHEEWLRKMQEISRQERAKWDQNQNENGTQLDIPSTSVGSQQFPVSDDPLKIDYGNVFVNESTPESVPDPKKEETICIKVVSRGGQKLLTPDSMMILRRALYPQDTKPVARISIDPQPSVNANSNLDPGSEDEFYNGLLGNRKEPVETTKSSSNVLISKEKQRVRMKNHNPKVGTRRGEEKSKSTSDAVDTFESESNCDEEEEEDEIPDKTKDMKKVTKRARNNLPSPSKAGISNKKINETRSDKNVNKKKFPKDRWGMSVKEPPKGFIEESKNTKILIDPKKTGELEIRNRMLEEDGRDFDGLYRNGRWGMKATSAGKDLKKTISSSRQGSQREGRIDRDVLWDSNTTSIYPKKLIPQNPLNSQHSNRILDISSTTMSVKIQELDHGTQGIPSIQQSQYDPPALDRGKFFPIDDSAENYVKKSLFLLTENLRAKNDNNQIIQPETRIFAKKCKGKKSN